MSQLLISNRACAVEDVATKPAQGWMRPQMVPLRDDQGETLRGVRINIVFESISLRKSVQEATASLNALIYGNFTACSVYSHFTSSPVNPHGGNCFTGESSTKSSSKSAF